MGTCRKVLFSDASSGDAQAKERRERGCGPRRGAVALPWYGGIYYGDIHPPKISDVEIMRILSTFVRHKGRKIQEKTQKASK